MSIQTNLSVSPYFDDYDETADFYRVLFKPSTAVQVRELNQLQTILQKQVERFGDHIFKRGTLLDGCQPTFNTSIPFVKIKDITADGRLPILEDYKGLFVKDNANLVARVIDVVDGFEAQSPDLKTLYLEYLNAGDNGNTEAFGNNAPLRVYNKDLRLYNIRVTNPSGSISNSDSVVILSALEVQNTTGGADLNGAVNVEDIIVQPDVPGEPSLEVIEIDTTSNTDCTILKVKPLLGQLAISNSASWSFRDGEQINNETTNTIVGFVSGFVGTGASARLTTLTGGQIDEVNLTRGGRNYYVEPHVTISSTITPEVDIDTAQFVAENFIANVVSAAVADHAGFAYGLSVSEGIVYQKGQFLRVGPQSIIVEKYANTPNDVSVGFETIESTVNSAIDETLLDNAGGFLNQNAPGADRLRLSPVLKVLPDDQAEQDAEFFPVIRFNEGRPFVTATSAVYNKLGEELARRTHEKAGNFVLDRFNITTRSTIDFAESANSFSYVIDPGHAYINGYRVKTDRNFAKTVDKGISTVELTDTAADIVYGNYVRVRKFAGVPAFTTGSVISLHSSASTYYDSQFDSAIAEPSNKIGEARVRSVVYERGDIGTTGAVYRVHLFDIQMNSGRDFSQVRSLYSSAGGVANALLEPSARNANTQIAVLKEVQNNSLLFNTEYPAKVIDTLKYRYRSSVSNRDIAASASATQLTISAETNAVWPYSGELTSTEKNEILVIPSATLIFDDSLSGTAQSANNTVVVGNNTNFIAELSVGDYVQIGADVARVNAIRSATQFSYLPTGRLNGLDGTIKKVYPKDIPIPLDNANAAIVSNELRINLNTNFTAAGSARVIYNLETNNIAPASKEVRRKRFVQIQANTHPDTNKGPWCLGIPDVFRLRKVYAGSNTSALDVTNEFYIDHNQTENFYGLSYLYKKPTSKYSIDADAELLVEFDHFVTSQKGLKTITSYPIDDTKPLSDLDDTVHTMEIPEVLSRTGELLDLRECLDFRPVPVLQANSVTIANIGNITTNPAETLDFSSDNQKFPIPEGDAFFRVEYYKGRTDTVVLNSDRIFDFKIGRTPRSNDPSEFLLYKVDVPPYPTLPINLSLQMQEIIDTKVANEQFTKDRRKRFTIRTERVERQTPGYTMEQISQLERRIAILEYYNNISLLEDQVKDRVIPSSVDATLERFKFGFFVDNFSTDQFADRESPEFNASIFGYLLQPAKYPFNLSLKIAESSLKYVDGSKLHFPYERRKLVSQPFATTTPPPPVIPDEPPAPEIETVCQFISNQTRRNDRNKSVFEENVFTLTNNSQADGLPITIKFDVFSGVDRFEFYQSASQNGPFTLIGTHESFAPTQLSSKERTELRNLRLKRGSTVAAWNNPDFAFRSDGTNPNYWLVNVGKITFNYNFQAGRFLKVRIVKGSPLHSYYICYPADGFVDPFFSESPILVLPPPPVVQLPPGEVSPPPPPAPPPPRDCGEGRIIETSAGRCFFANDCGLLQPVPCPRPPAPPPEPIVIPVEPIAEDPPPPPPQPIVVDDPGVKKPEPEPVVPPVYTVPDPIDEPDPLPPPPPAPTPAPITIISPIDDVGFLDLR